ncbi:MAG: hypothetical protein KKH12_01860, partial [Gammaproteobacteria bacterium]|nr:hypothetical protein [Gammaproteobacteria bacterium]MBU1480399.1 hypothetical protein [Gammaproteobacteria bacterium]
GSLSGFTYTTGIVTADCQVTASFDSMAVTHQVTATAGTGGSITPASRTVDDGATTTFTVTPDAGNFIAGVTGCGGLLSGSTYTTGAVTADCQVSASFGAPSVSDGQAAAIVIGQPDFTSKTPGLTQTGFGSSALFGNVAVDNGILYVPDFDSNRVLGYNTIPSSNEAAADFVLGAANFTTPGSLGGPGSMVAYDGKLYASMYYSNRIDVYNPSPSATGATPAFSLTATGAGGYGGMLNVESVGVGGGKLAVADAGHNRVLVWNSIPASNTDPDLVLGQTTVSGIAANAGGLSASSMRYPSGIWTDGTRLVVLDKDNNRVLVWNTFPTTNGQAADLVLGQADSTSAQLNRGLGAPTAATLNEPYNGVYSDGIRLFVTDSNNNRVLVWNSWPTQSGQAADAVLGQPDFVSSAPATTETGMDGPTGVILVGTQLLVTDGRNVRCMIYNLP